jgi:3-hydroxyisobutyrate dehydrogenase
VSEALAAREEPMVDEHVSTNRTAHPMRIAVVGAGAMGLPIARRLHDAEHDVIAVDPFEPQLERAAASGIAGVTSVERLPERDVAILMVVSGEQATEVAGSEFMRSRRAPSHVVVMSTVGPDAVRALAEQLRARGIAVIDCPVTGGIAGAADGTLTLLVGADDDAFEAVRPLLDVLGRTERVGGIGDGQSMKLVNNHLACVNATAVAETINFARALELPLDRVFDILRSGAAQSWMLENRFPRMAQLPEDRATDTVTAIIAKDSALIRAAAQQAGAATPLIDETWDVYRRAMAQGWAKLDDACIADPPVARGMKAGAADNLTGKVDGS